jgi:hypothetical protein
LGLGQVQQRRVQLHRPLALNSGPRGQVGHRFIGRKILGPAIRIAAVVERIDAQKNVARIERLGIGQRQREEDCVAGRHIRDWDATANLLGGGVLGHCQVAGQGRAADRSQVDVERHVPLDSLAGGHAGGRGELLGVPLAIAEA